MGNFSSLGRRSLHTTRIGTFLLGSTRCLLFRVNAQPLPPSNISEISTFRRCSYVSGFCLHTLGERRKDLVKPSTLDLGEERPSDERTVSMWLEFTPSNFDCNCNCRNFCTTASSCGVGVIFFLQWGHCGVQP